MHGIGERVPSLYDHPKLIDPAIGTVLSQWPELKTGQQVSSIIWSKRPEPFVLDEDKSRFAVANGLDVTIIEIV